MPPDAGQTIEVGSGGSGMIASALRERGARDVEHRSPKYLRTEEHARELLGEQEKTVPPAIGEQ